MLSSYVYEHYPHREGLSTYESNKMPTDYQRPATGNTVNTTEIWRLDNSSGSLTASKEQKLGGQPSVWIVHHIVLALQFQAIAECQL